MKEKYKKSIDVCLIALLQMLVSVFMVRRGYYAEWMLDASLAFLMISAIVTTVIGFMCDSELEKEEEEEEYEDEEP
jgi:hypothetical protein